ncbi:MAG: SUMF1/EgtB/PvdO family nonheme iron enzyme [Myxococcales bacterium]
MLCYRCGSHVPDGSEVCGACGQKFSSGNLRQATGTFSRRKLSTALGIDGAPFKPGDVLCDRYLVKDAVGQGPLGYTFKAQDKEIDVEVALKAISPKLVQTQDERRAFAKEIRLARKLSHNNLIRVYEDGEDSDRPFYTMQFLDGLTLRRIIDLRKEKGQFFALKEIEPIFAQIVAGLEAAHKVLVHTDLKPENIVVLPDLLKITDIGIGNAIPRQPFVAAQRARGISYRYLAPEYVSGTELDRRADVYSLGVLLGEMVANTFPEGAGSLELRAKNPDLPPVLETVYRRATNENPLSRHATVAEFWSELDSIILKVSPRSSTPSKRPTSPRPLDSEESFAINPDDTRTPSVPTRPVSERPERPAPPAMPNPQAPSERRERRSVPPPPVPLSGEDPAFTKPAPPVSRPNGEPAATAETTEVMQVPGNSGRRRAAAHTPPPSRRRSGAGPLLWLGILGIVAGVGGGYVYLTFFRGPANVAGTGNDPVPMVAGLDASTAAPPDKVAEDKRLEDERRAAEARRLEEERRLADSKKLEEDRRLDEEKKLAEAKRLEEEKRRKDLLAKAFPGKDDPKKDPAKDPAKDPVPAKTPDPQPDKPAGKAGTCPAGMKLVAAGTLRMGSAKDDPMTGFDEKPLVPVEVEAYCIDYFESPNRPGVMPTVHVTFAAAEAACKARSKRLCTEEEWERACKGPGNARFPYGATFDSEVCNTSDAEGEPRNVGNIGAYAKCRSAFGVGDMSGNVAEWTSSPFSAEVGDKTIKGGAADRPDYDTRCAARKNGPPGTHTDKLGFRCCADPN